MAALTKYADSDSTKDPGSDEEKSNKGKKNDNGKGQQQNMTGQNQGNNGNVSNWMAGQILWPTPMHSVILSVVRVGRSL